MFKGFVIILILIKIILLIYFASAEQLGDIHTSVAHISHLVNAEVDIVASLNKYIQQEEKRLEKVRKYVNEWNHANSASFLNNPLNSYHLLQRITNQFKQVEHSLSDLNSVKKFEDNRDVISNLPSESDVNGAAWAIVRLQKVYNLTLDDLVRGFVSADKATKGLNADDCLRFGKLSFHNLEFDSSESWTLKGIELIENQGPLSLEDEAKIKQIRVKLNKRKMMKRMVTEMAQKSHEELDHQFSGLGMPFSFQKSIYFGKEEGAHLEEMEDTYVRLCRGENLQSPVKNKDHSCAFVSGRQTFYRYLMPFKLELIWSDPIMIVYHDVITDKEAEMMRNLAFPKLETTQVHSFMRQSMRKSLSRVGKTAWVHKGESPVVDTILQRIADMTGLATDNEEHFHILNYGVGGHYDVHVDFFDLKNKNSTSKMHQGDRIATVLFYLTDVEAGGSTVFPALKIGIPARKNSAVVWFNLKRNGQGDYRTAHAACPVLLGQKWIANLWVHEFEQVFRWPCTRNPEE